MYTIYLFSIIIFLCIKQIFIDITSFISIIEL